MHLILRELERNHRLAAAPRRSRIAEGSRTRTNTIERWHAQTGQHTRDRITSYAEGLKVMDRRAQAILGNHLGSQLIVCCVLCR